VASKSEFETLLRFPWILYQHDPYWVPPLVSLQRHKLDKARNPTWKHLEGEYFVARRGDRPVGTIAAFINHRHNEFQGEHVGFFGLFEVYDDQAAANALLEAAAGYIRAKGYDAIRGPASFSTNDECGVLIDGFDEPPAILMPYNYPYYQRLLERAPGFHPAMDLVSYNFELQDFQRSDKLEQAIRVMRKNNERRQIKVRTLDAKHMKQELEILRRVYNQAWERNWGFVPLSDEELDALVKDLGQFVEHRLAYFAEVKGEPAAFMLAFPDLNQALKWAYPRPGKPDWLSMAQVFWHWKIRSKITRIRVALLGVREGYRGIGVEGSLFVELFEQAIQLSKELGWQRADAGWVLETNEPMRRLVEGLNGTAYKRYRFYERAL
jgi:GNAT superfamily N-acetyltransferase